MTENKLTDKEIIKALECIASNENVLCDSCPNKKLHLLECHRQGAKFALDLITRQQAEIERLEKLLAVTVKVKNDYANQLEQVIENLKIVKAEAIKALACDIYEEIDKAIKNNQDVKKQRRKRLIWRGNNVENDTFLHYVEGKIDALKGIKYFVFDYVKEMVGEDN